MTILSKTVGNEFFLQGKYLAVGLSKDGSIGTTGAAPTGVNSDTEMGYLRLGLVGDTDGFGVGKAATRDAIVRGVGVEGFNIGYKAGGKTYVQSNQTLTGLSEIAGKGSSTATDSAATAVWNGVTTEKLQVNQKVTLGDDAKYLRIEVTLTNASGAALNDLRYMRTMDPDLAVGFATVNTVVKQGEGSALITAAATANSDPLFLYANDPRAVVTTYGFINENPYDAKVATPQAVGTRTTTDTSINIDFTLGTLEAGGSTTLVFYLGITDNLSTTIQQIDKLFPAGAGSAPIPEKPANDAPDAVDDAVSVVSGNAVKGNVLSNDKDANGDALTATLKTGPANGTVTLNADGTYTYTANKGYTGTDSFTYTASDGKATDTATVKVTVNAAPNTGPVATADTATVTAGATTSGNVLSNDKDADGDTLTAALRTGPANGKVTLNVDGTYTYTANKGYAGTDSFTYTASDGKATDTATVTVTVTAPEIKVPVVTAPDIKAPVVTAPDIKLPDSGLELSDLIKRGSTVDGSASTSDTLKGAAGPNSFYFDLAAKTGADKISNFGRDDVLVTKGMLYDGNNDGLITFTKNKLSLDVPKSTDSVTITGVSSLRYLGTDEAGLSIYANATVKPKGAIEGTINDDVLKGGAGDLKKDVFFFDTALGLDLGNDRIDNFGAKDILVTTSALSSISLGTDGLVKLGGGLGEIDLNGMTGAPVPGLELDGTVVKNGVSYFVYSAAGSSAGLADLAF